MKIMLESTDRIVTVNGIEARIWQGESASGIACHAYITRIAVRRDLDCAEFERELLETAAPRPELNGIPLRMVL